MNSREKPYTLRFVEISAQLLAIILALTGIAGGVLAAPETETMRIEIPILVYHHIRDAQQYPRSTWSYKMSVSLPVFQNQLDWIKARGYTTVTLDEALAILSGEKAGPEKPIVLTFDDNNRSQYIFAFPELFKRQQMGVFYFVTNRLKNQSFILEDEVRLMSTTGMDIQSHTTSHSTLTALSLSRLDQELQDSRQVLEALLQKPVEHVAYPSTAQNQAVRDHARLAGYSSATIMDPRNATSQDDVFRLPRIMMTDDTNLEAVLP